MQGLIIALVAMQNCVFGFLSGPKELLFPDNTNGSLAILDDDANGVDDGLEHRREVISASHVLFRSSPLSSCLFFSSAAYVLSPSYAFSPPSSVCANTSGRLPVGPQLLRALWGAGAVGHHPNQVHLEMPAHAARPNRRTVSRSGARTRETDDRLGCYSHLRAAHPWGSGTFDFLPFFGLEWEKMQGVKQGELKHELKNDELVAAIVSKEAKLHTVPD